MASHNRRWYQQIHLSPTWVCTICEFDTGVYSNPQALYSHLQEFHHDGYTNEQLRVISQQSKVKQPRAWDNCLLCGFQVEEENNKDTAGFKKQTIGELRHSAVKSARTTYSMMHPGHYSSDDSDFSDTASDLDMDSLQQRLQRTEDRSKAIARHIAMHLQVLMLLTMRFAALQKDNNDLVDDDLKSDYVDIDDEGSFSGGNNPENLSGTGSGRDVAMEDMDNADDFGVPEDLANDLVEDDKPVPDTDLVLHDIPRPYDGLVAENDAFLNNLIESGAWQSWQDENKEPLRHDLKDYTIGWICATSTEHNVSRALLDDVHEEPEHIDQLPNADTYTFGQIGRHNVIISTAACPRNLFELSDAAEITRIILHRFRNIKFCLLVGIGGGAPSPEHDIRLGDVIVGYSSAEREGSVIQYTTRHIEKFAQLGVLNQPPAVLRAAINRHRSRYEKERRILKAAIADTLKTHYFQERGYERPTTDRLYRSDFVHYLYNGSDCTVVCGDNPSDFIQRPERAEDGPAIHYGLIASADLPMEDALARDKWSKLKNILCFEHEAPGLSGDISCLMIRGICHYSDSHNNERWQIYAAVAAAVYAKQLLCEISPISVKIE